MPPTRTGSDVERPGLNFPPGVLVDADGNPVGFEEVDDLAPNRPGRGGRRGRNFVSRALRGLADRVLGNRR